MLYVDLKYIAAVSSHLRNFKKKKDNLFNCSCPVCGDSDKKKTKARGYFYQKGSSMFFKCHNCSTGLGIANFLKHNFPNYYDQFILEKYKSDTETKRPPTDQTLKQVEMKKEVYEFCSEFLIPLNQLPMQHYAKTYVLNRKIPQESLERLYYTDDFAAVVENIFPGRYTTLQKNDPRLVIPFFDANNELIGLQGRSFSPDKALRYITIRSSESVDLLYGLDKLDVQKPPVFVVEGPIDSLFLPNCVAAANSDLLSASEKLPKCVDVILVYDNEPRNREIVKLLETAIKSGKKVCVWSSTIEQKDINDMVLSGKTKEDIAALILSRTFSGLEAQLEFSKWKKV